MHPSRQFGPWATGLDVAELRARLRSLRAIARILAGRRATAMNALLLQAETDPAALVPAADALDGLAPLDRRRILAAYAATPYPPALGTLPQARPFLRATPRPWSSHVPLRCLRAGDEKRTVSYRWL